MTSATYIWAMRISIALDAIIGIGLSIFRPMVAENGLWGTLALTAAAVAISMWSVTWFMSLWTGGWVKQLMAAMFTMLVSAGGAFSVMLVGAVIFYGEPATSIMQLPMIFVGGAMLAQVALFAHPITLVTFLIFAVWIGFLAHRVERAQAIEERRANRTKQSAAPQDGEVSLDGVDPEPIDRSSPLYDPLDAEKRGFQSDKSPKPKVA